MAERTYAEWVEEHKRLCALTRKIFDVIACDSSAEARRLGVAHLLRLSVCESAMHQCELQWIQGQIQRIQDKLGLPHEPLPSGVAARRTRRGKE